MKGQKRELIVAVLLFLVVLAILLYILLTSRGFSISIFPV